jgi:hypothetical protein
MTIEACPPSIAPTLGVVVFDPAAFIASYPMFSTVATNTLTANFGVATLYLNNSCCSVVTDANVRQSLLNLLTAHVTALFNGVGGAAPAGIVGRIAQATEGSVSVAAEYSSQVSQSQAWYLQTAWGAAYWAATVNYRGMRYVAAPRRNYGPWPLYGGPGMFPIGGPGWGGWAGCG